MRSGLVVVGLGHRHSALGLLHNSSEERGIAELHVGAAWKDGACVICSVNELHNCPEERCTGELHAGALLEMWH